MYRYIIDHSSIIIVIYYILLSLYRSVRSLIDLLMYNKYQKNLIWSIDDLFHRYVFNIKGEKKYTINYNGIWVIKLYSHINPIYNNKIGHFQTSKLYTFINRDALEQKYFWEFPCDWKTKNIRIVHKGTYVHSSR